MSVLDAFACPYCGGALLRESYYVRCGSEHRFTAAFRGRSASSSRAPDEPPAGGADGRERVRGPKGAGEAAEVRAAEPAEPGLVLRVIAHPHRGEIGRLHLFRLEEP